MNTASDSLSSCRRSGPLTMSTGDWSAARWFFLRYSGRRIQASIRIACSAVLERSRMRSWMVTVSAVMVTESTYLVGCDFISGSLDAGVNSFLACHSSSFCLRNPGPFSQRCSLVSWWGWRPRLASSAGLSVPGTCRHWPGSESSRISPTRFPTNG